jgi:serine/threonine protein kinase
MQQGEIYLDSYHVVTTLGSGQSATVYLLEDDSGGLWAGKVLLSTNPALRDRNLSMLRQEAQMLRVIHSDKVVRMIDVNDTGVLLRDGLPQRCAYLVLEHCAGGELYDFVHDSGRFSEELTRFYFKAILEAVVVCHRAGIAHCDLKLDNVLLDTQFQVKLADFGLATSVGTCQNGSMEAYRGTPYYMAPEIHARKPYHGFSADLFALGVCLFIMLTRACPFKSATSTDNHYCLFVNDNSRFWRLHSQISGVPISQEFANLVTSLLALDPAHRLSLAEVIAHPWMQGPVASDVPLQMTARREIVVREKARRIALENTQRLMVQRQAQASKRPQKKKTDYNELVDELVSSI